MSPETGTLVESVPVATKLSLVMVNFNTLFVEISLKSKHDKPEALAVAIH